ncbi:type II toxin-antitoxin system RelE/ParE family toxin [Parahaliea mediterranea]|uniref:type II toxin-antitoxin system RelE/ParE family toxin n=1 Tax=Parahaliea mediterranea TaxID=651086 RepID=UPI000E2F471A|nr:type II toxin-antitoxin system RelE/ParE family toxin [Parahaliea mediterranea]
MPAVKIHAEAARELEQAAAWYEREQPGLGSRLIEAFEHALVLLTEPNAPLTPVLGQAAQLGAKKLILHKFPFSLITIEAHGAIVVVALAHHARRPGYWHSRSNP